MIRCSMLVRGPAVDYHDLRPAVGYACGASFISRLPAPSCLFIVLGTRLVVGTRLAGDVDEINPRHQRFKVRRNTTQADQVDIEARFDMTGQRHPHDAGQTGNAVGNPPQHLTFIGHVIKLDRHVAKR